MISLAVLESLQGGSLTSDAVLLIKEESSNPISSRTKASACKRQKVHADGSCKTQEETCSILAHRAVLWAMSEYFESKIKNWSNSSSTDSSKCEVTLLVPPGQLELGKALLVTMYHQLPEQLSQQELLQLLSLADSYKIDKVISAVVSKISSMPVDQLEWDTVLAVLQLPAEPLYEPATAAAMSRMLQLLGDLDIVWGLERPDQRSRLQEKIPRLQAAAERVIPMAHKVDQLRTAERRVSQLSHAVIAAAASKTMQLHELLLQLPYEQLLLLLQSKELQVASEDTVHYTITRWMQQQSRVSVGQCKQLLGLLRLECCSPTYLLSNVLQTGSWVLKHLAADTSAQLMAFSLAQQQKLKGIKELSGKMLRVDHWAPTRADSALKTFEIDWSFPLADIRTVYHQRLEDQNSNAAWVADSPTYYLQGRKFRLGLDISVHAEEDAEDSLGTPRFIRLMAEVVDAEGHFSCCYRAWRAGFDGRKAVVSYKTESAGVQWSSLGDDGLLLMFDSAAVNVEVQEEQAPALIEVSNLSDWEAVEQ